MADVSLDDYINKKNLTVQIRNVGATNRSGLKSGFAKGKIKFQKTQQGNTRGQLKSPKNFQFRKKGQLSLQTKKNGVMSLQTRKNRGLQDRSTNMKNISVSIPNKNVAGFNQKTFDARDKIAKRPLDARERLAAKSKLTDARARIQQKKGKQSNTGKVVITGLNTTSSRQNNTQITRTFSQKPLGGVQMSGNSISITRNIGNTQEDTYQQNDQENSAGNFKITRTLHGNPRSGIQMSGNSISITRNVSNTQNVKMSNNRGPVIELRNDSYGVSAPTDEDYDEYYSHPSSQIHTTEKTLTVKLPQSSKPQQIPVITSKPPIKLGNVAVKRKAPVPISFETAAPVSGPLKLAGGPLKLGGGPLKFAKSTMVADSVGVVKKPKIIKQDVRMEIAEAEEPAAPVVNSIQGFKVNITNLHPVVSQDDITELFGSVGTMKRARLVREGVAEVVYLQRDDATKAIQKYHNRELDGIPMQVKLMVPKPAPVPKPVMATPVADESPNGEPLKLFKGTSKTSQESNIESSTLHRALFKTGVTQQPSKLVTFTVKI